MYDSLWSDAIELLKFSDTRQHPIIVYKSYVQGVSRYFNSN